MSRTIPLRTLASYEAADAIKRDLRFHLKYTLGRLPEQATPRELLHALSLAVRRPVMEAFLDTEWRQRGAKRVAYLSMEFLMGRALENNLLNLGLREAAGEALTEFGTELDTLCAREQDPALGNGGLGRLAACFLDSLATLDLPATGYGINYEYGLFRQEIRNGEQREHPDPWLDASVPCLIERPEEAVLVPVYGRIVEDVDARGEYNPMWLGWRLIVGVPHDFLVVGFGGSTVNPLRLFSARSSDDFDMRIFNSGDYILAMQEKIATETISKVLYPADDIPAGRELRLVQEYFLVACAVRDILRRFRDTGAALDQFPAKIAVQLNDTHPALAVAELMRVFIDEEGLDWERAWELTRGAVAYTNHTLLSEALEKWPVSLLEHVLPRHLQLIYEINRRFLAEVDARWPGDDARRYRMSLVEEGEPKQVRMAHLAIVGSHSVNGVARLHSDLVKTQLVPDLHDMWPERFNNKTNGITQRRWLLQANPALAQLLTRVVGTRWLTHLEHLRRIERLADDPGFQDDFTAVKRHNKERLARVIADTTGVLVDPSSLFDVQIKRIHEYKRQLLNVMHVLHLYRSIIDDDVTLPGPRTCIFSGKAAPGYALAKRIIHLIHAVADLVNHDPRVRGQLKVVFLPDYRVSLAEQIVPAADLSEQISTAGKEASGTGNMKLALNGALTIATLDGANVEIQDEVGPDNIFIFGLTVAEVEARRRRQDYDPRQLYTEDAALRRVVDAIADDSLCPRRPGAFSEIAARLLVGDEYFHMADFHSYVTTQDHAANEFRRHRSWTRKAILNVARMGKFSSDRTILEYADEIWGLTPVK
ncbi:MAG TPA: glycogen/starch/alpha-glucan phosphorylase [Polyangia bacterium]|jgi:starch phosphorylase|nr:glycogen/starch/alpha-glucan phosphorylase [Polyangia bacterium]